jgi:hypothetical protein
VTERLRALLVVAALVVVVGCGSDSTTSATSTGCRETSSASPGAAAGTPTFGPLGAEPSVVVHLPRTHRAPTTDTTYPADTYPDVTWGRVRGATVIAAAPAEHSDSTASLLTAVDDDGTVRWTRCLPGDATVGAGEDGELVVVSDGHAVSVLDAADGTQRRGEEDLDAIVGAGGRYAFLADDDEDHVARRLARLDLRTGRRLDIASPPRESAMSVDEDGVLHDDDVVWTEGDGWHRDTTTTSAEWSYDEPSALVGHGAASWSLPLHPAAFEGVPLVQDGETVVAWTCESVPDEGRCPLGVVGVDLATGRELWHRPGDALLSVGDDGYVLLQHGFGQGGWVLHDMRTGEAVAGQTWSDPTAFQQGCCEEGRWRNVGRVGGTVVVQHDTEVRIWFAKGTSHPRVDVRP